MWQVSCSQLVIRIVVLEIASNRPQTRAVGFVSSLLSVDGPLVRPSHSRACGVCVFVRYIPSPVRTARPDILSHTIYTKRDARTRDRFPRRVFRSMAEWVSDLSPDRARQARAERGGREPAPRRHDHATAICTPEYGGLTTQAPRFPNLPKLQTYGYLRDSTPRYSHTRHSRLRKT